MNEGTEKRLEYERIKSEANSLGLSISELCRESNVERNVLHRWKGKNPKTIDILNSLNTTLDRIKEAKQKQIQ